MKINMRFGVIGTGMVGKTLASKLVSLGHEVKMGSRSANNEKAAAWVKEAGKSASHGTFADAAAFGEVVFVCTKGDVTLDAVRAAGAANLKGKVVIDVSNPLDVSKGMPPSMIPEFTNTNSLGEAVQELIPDSYVVKALNMINCAVMVNPAMLQGDSEILISGNDATAKNKVIDILKSFGWKNPIDLGDITTARGTEMYIALWMRLMGVLGTAQFNFRIVK
jgi:8-hydroxy-5-deazaflavin:NADPH oxidoreductase